MILVRNNLRVLFFLGFILLLVAPTLSTFPCEEVCPDVYDPVCAYNGKAFVVYSNQCYLDVAICRKEPGQELFQVSNKFCAIPEKEQNKCPKFCTLQYDPVCAYNGTGFVIYGNQCVLDKAICKKQPGEELFQVSKPFCSLPEKQTELKQ